MAALAKAAGCSRRAIEMYLSGRRSGRRRGKATLERVAQALGVPAVFLESGERAPRGYRVGSRRTHAGAERYVETDKGRLEVVAPPPKSLLDCAASDADRELLAKTFKSELAIEAVGLIVDAIDHFIAAADALEGPTRRRVRDVEIETDERAIAKGQRELLGRPLLDGLLKPFGGRDGLAQMLDARRAARVRSVGAEKARHALAVGEAEARSAAAVPAPLPIVYDSRPPN